MNLLSVYTDKGLIAVGSEDQQRIVAALIKSAEAGERESRSHKWTGPQWHGVRAELRAGARHNRRLAAWLS